MSIWPEGWFCSNRVCVCVRAHVCVPASTRLAVRQQEVTTIQWVAAVSFCSPDYRKWVCDGPDTADTLMGVSLAS